MACENCDLLAAVFCEVHKPSRHDDPSEWHICPCCEAVHQSDRADSLAAQVVRLREALRGMRDWQQHNFPHASGAHIIAADKVLAGTEAAATAWLEADRREQRLKGARDLFTRAEARLSLPTKASYYLDALTAELEAMEDEANGNEH